MSAAAVTYKGYTILQQGLSRYIYRPGEQVPAYRESKAGAAGWGGTQREAREWVNADLRKGATAS